MAAPEETSDSREALAARRRRRLRTALIGSVLIAVITFGDLLITEGRLADPPPACAEAADPGCNDARNDALFERIDEADELESGLATRAVVAAIGLTLIWLMYAGFTVRRERDDPGAWMEAFRDVGSAGVGWVAIGGAALLLSGDDLVGLPAALVLIPALTLIPVAAVGAFVSRSMLGGGAAPAPAPRAALGYAGTAGLGFAAASAAVYLIALTILDGGCGVYREPVVDALFWAGLGMGLVGALLGVAALFARQWGRALVCILAFPVGYVGAYVLSGCAS